MSFCTNCGAQLNEGARFCPKCGAYVEQPSEGSSFQQTPLSMEESASGKKKSSLPLVLVIVAAVIVLGVAGFFFYKKTFAPGIVGAWEDEYGFDLVIFNKDGSCSFGGVMGMYEDATYKANGDTVTVYAGGFSQNFSYTLNGKDEITFFDPETGTGLVFHRVNGDQPEAEVPTALVQDPPVTATVPVTEAVTAAVVETAPLTPAADPYEGCWYDHSGKCEVELVKTGDSYQCNIYQNLDTASDTSMTVHKEGNRLVYSDGIRVLAKNDMNGQRASIQDATRLSGYFIATNDSSLGGTAFMTEDPNAEYKYLMWTENDPAYTPLSREYVIWYSSDLLLTDSDVKFLSKDELRIARNEIYARHGRKFNSADLQQYFNGCSWYRGTIDASAFSDDSLSDLEKKNIKLIEKFEE